MLSIMNTILLIGIHRVQYLSIRTTTRKLFLPLTEPAGVSRQVAVDTTCIPAASSSKPGKKNQLYTSDCFSLRRKQYKLL